MVSITVIRKAKSRIGHENGRHELCAADVRWIRAMAYWIPDIRRRLLAEIFGVTERNINRIIAGEHWAGAGGYIKAGEVDADEMEFDETLLIRCKNCRSKVYASKADRSLCTLCAREASGLGPRKLLAA